MAELHPQILAAVKAKIDISVARWAFQDASRDLTDVENADVARLAAGACLRWLEANCPSDTPVSAFIEATRSTPSTNP